MTESWEQIKYEMEHPTTETRAKYQSYMPTASGALAPIKIIHVNLNDTIRYGSQPTSKFSVFRSSINQDYKK